MPGLAEKQAIVIVSKDQDFADTLAEQVRNELSLPCVHVSDTGKIQQHVHSALVVISSETTEEALPCPVITIKNPPVKLMDVLDDIARLLQNDTPEDISLGRGYFLQSRQKQLNHGDKSVDLTDKEAQILQELAATAGQVVTKDQLLKTIWGFGESLDTHTLETHIYRLRGKFRELAGDESMIAATEGGYKLEL